MFQLINLRQATSQNNRELISTHAPCSTGNRHCSASTDRHHNCNQSVHSFVLHADANTRDQRRHLRLRAPRHPLKILNTPVIHADDDVRE